MGGSYGSSRPTVFPLKKELPFPTDKFRWYMVQFPFNYPEEEEEVAQTVR